MTERNIHSQNGNVYYWVSRHGNPFAQCVIFLHGLIASHILFDRQLAYFSRNNTVIAWDAPAHGKSRPYSDFSYFGAAEELKTIMDTEGINKAILVGQSMGGYVAQIFAEKYPDRVSAFIGIDTCPFDTSFYSGASMWLLRQVGWMSRLYSPKSLKEKIARRCTYTDKAYKDMISNLDELTGREISGLLKLGFSGFVKELHDIALPCPAMLIVGEHDKVGNVLKYNLKWHEKQNYTLQIIPNASHNSNSDNPEECNKLIDEFLSELNVRQAANK